MTPETHEIDTSSARTVRNTPLQCLSLASEDNEAGDGAGGCYPDLDARCSLDGFLPGSLPAGVAQALLVVVGLTVGALIAVRVALSVADRRAKERTTHLLKELSTNGESDE